MCAHRAQDLATSGGARQAGRGLPDRLAGTPATSPGAQVPSVAPLCPTSLCRIPGGTAIYVCLELSLTLLEGLKVATRCTFRAADETRVTPVEPEWSMLRSVRH